jgi:hypothetical protein
MASVSIEEYWIMRKVSGLEMCIKVNDILHLLLYKDPIVFVLYPPSPFNCPVFYYNRVS